MDGPGSNEPVGDVNGGTRGGMSVALGGAGHEDRRREVVGSRMRWVLRSLLALLGLIAGVALTVLVADQVTAPRKADLTPLIEKARAYDVVIRDRKSVV